MQAQPPQPTRRSSKLLLRLAKWILGLFLGTALLLVVIGVVIHEPRPEGEETPKAEDLARSMERAANVEAWKTQTHAVAFTFAGVHHYLWDRQRGFVRVRWDDREVLLRTSDQTGTAYRGGTEVEGAEREALLREAYGYFINDSFWLNPLAKLFDDGVVRETVGLEGGNTGLLVTYDQGGLTPGDAYLWILGPDGLPRSWKMWVEVLPVGGIEASWDGWKTLATGAKVSTLHEAGPIELRLSDVRGASELSKLESGRPFALLE
jgi:hypothetical protein